MKELFFFDNQFFHHVDSSLSFLPKDLIFLIRDYYGSWSNIWPRCLSVEQQIRSKTNLHKRSHCIWKLIDHYYLQLETSYLKFIIQFEISGHTQAVLNTNKHQIFGLALISDQFNPFSDTPKGIQAYLLIDHVSQWTSYSEYENKSFRGNPNLPRTLGNLYDDVILIPHLSIPTKNEKAKRIPSFHILTNQSLSRKRKEY